MVCTKREPAVSRDTSRATRTGPFSTTRILAGPEQNSFGVADRGHFRQEEDLALGNLRRYFPAVGIRDLHVLRLTAGELDVRFDEIFTLDVQRVEYDDWNAGSGGVEGRGNSFCCVGEHFG